MSELLPQAEKSTLQQLMPTAIMKNQASPQVATSSVSIETDTAIELEKLSRSLMAATTTSRSK